MSCEGPTQVGSGSGGFNAGGLILLALHYIQQKTEDYSEDGGGGAVALWTSF